LKNADVEGLFVCSVFLTFTVIIQNLIRVLPQGRF